MRSPLADQLPPGAFFARDGERVVEHGRYHLDLSHPAARRSTWTGWSTSWSGTSASATSRWTTTSMSGRGQPAGGPARCRAVGAQPGLLGLGGRRPRPSPRSHSRELRIGRDAYRLCVAVPLPAPVHQRPAGFTRYPAIAAAAPMAITPEQAAVWAYPQPEWSDDEIAFTLCGALLGRVHLSGHIDRMAPAQQQLVADAISAYKQIRPDLAAAVPFWPLGLPRWTDPWVALGMRSSAATYVLVWRRGTPGIDPAPDEGAGRRRGRPNGGRCTGRAHRCRGAVPGARWRQGRLGRRAPGTDGHAPTLALGLSLAPDLTLDFNIEHILSIGRLGTGTLGIGAKPAPGAPGCSRSQGARRARCRKP